MSTSTEVREELLDRPPNRWYQTGFLIPSETSLGDRADDGADDTGASEAGSARRMFFTYSVGLCLLIPPATGLDVTVHWAGYKPTAPLEDSKADEACLHASQ